MRRAAEETEKRAITASVEYTVDKARQTAPAAPTAASKSGTSITLTAVEGCEYSRDGGPWQTSPSFTGLKTNTAYTFYQRYAEKDNYYAPSSSDGTTITTNAHTHEWSYTASGATITATCADTDGGHEGSTTATLTIVKPAHTAYGDGKSAEATITGSIDGVENPSVVYKKGDATLTAAPTGAGSYTASITLGGATASVSYKIAEGSGTDAVVPEIVMWSATDVDVRAVEGQEYVIALKGAQPDWTKTVDAADGFVTFENLTPATEYTVHTRVKATGNTQAGASASTDIMTSLIGYGCDGFPVVGRTVTIVPEPEDTTGLTYQWFHIKKEETDEGVEHTVKLNAIENGVMSGMGDGTFAPNGTTTRAQLATILWNMEGKRKVSGGVSFNDVGSGDWFYDAINWASAQGIILGYADANGAGKVFAPNDPITREQLVTILYRYANLKGVNTNAQDNLKGFTDAKSVSAWATDAMRWAVGSGLVSGKTATTLNP
ncbi:MAG: S-layer homology domain-containing protein, partial [Ruminococcaceae bacterium]|nr:S-layer homology domain-containing protein [Oscillospiraceae bacterium]